MQRRSFLSTSLAAGIGISATTNLQPTAAAPKPDEPEVVLIGRPVVSGPAAESITILQGVFGPVAGYLEFAIGDGEFQRVDAESNGLLPLEQYALKFRLPPLPAGKEVKYRITARSIEFKNAYNIVQGPVEVSETYSFRTLDPAAGETRFLIWNDTHENQETIRALHKVTSDKAPDFLLWNGDQTNDVYDPLKMTNQYLSPSGLDVAARWPLAYARGNHDVRGPAARHLPEFTGTPDDRFYYGFRSGPLAALVMDTGEDKPDDHPVFAGLAGFAAMRERQTKWLASTIREDWFRSAPYRILFCHIPLWWTDETSNPGYFLFAKPCREAWLPLLKEGKIQLVVSGHTHRATWLPAGDDRPIGQLIGGGPKLSAATIIEGNANGKELILSMRSLDGKVLQEVKIPA
ncbi:metallophosphoesterase [Anatilimnocola sp. NA78]|uniref:metallophosphoesterase family protein n=1 Tax=Anatilimnocola sp. NA78 TaxID=3415683 RepID=UPI003CE5A508